MPQLDFSTWIGQFFWTTVALATLYLAFVFFVIPRMRSIFERRQQKIDGDLRRAEKMRAEAEDILQKYTKDVKMAREAALRKIKDAVLSAEKSAELRVRETKSKIDVQTKALLKDIEKRRCFSINNIDPISIDIAHGILKKFLHNDFEKIVLRRVLQDLEKEKI